MARPVSGREVQELKHQLSAERRELYEARKKLAECEGKIKHDAVLIARVQDAEGQAESLRLALKESEARRIKAEQAPAKHDAKVKERLAEAEKTVAAQERTLAAIGTTYCAGCRGLEEKVERLKQSSARFQDAARSSRVSLGRVQVERDKAQADRRRELKISESLRRELAALRKEMADADSTGDDSVVGDGAGDGAGAVQEEAAPV